MALSKIQSESMNLADTYAFTGTVTGAGGGKVLQVKQTSINSEVSASPTGNATFADISGMSVSITPASTANKILVSYSVNIGRTVASQNNSVRLVRDSTPIVGTGASLTNNTTLHRQDTAQIDNGGITYLDSPATTSAVTYKLQWASESGGTIYLNRRGTSNGFVGVSTITVMEIEG